MTDTAAKIAIIVTEAIGMMIAAGGVIAMMAAYTAVRMATDIQRAITTTPTATGMLAGRLPLSGAARRQAQ